jgi:hypothetical protein
MMLALAISATLLATMYGLAFWHELRKEAARQNKIQFEMTLLRTGLQKREAPRAPSQFELQKREARNALRP